MTIEHWNKLIKPLETDTTAADGDIVAYIDGLYCLCQRKEDCNNIVVFSNDFDIRHTKAMFKFIIEIYDKGIRYIRVEGSHNRYKLFSRIFGMNMLLQVVNSTGRDVYWCKLDDNIINRIKLLIRKEK